MTIINYVTGNQVKPNKTRSNRVASMLENKEKQRKPVQALMTPSLFNRFSNLFSDKTPLPTGSIKKIPLEKKLPVGGKLTDYNKRALQFLSDRSHSIAMMNLKKIKSKKTRKALAKALRSTRRKR